MKDVVANINVVSTTISNYEDVFKKIYYYLYTNSRVSRAETIVSDLANLLLCKIASERNGHDKLIDEFLNKDRPSSETLISILRASIPHIIGPDEKFNIEDRALRVALRELDALSLSSAPGHLLGDAFQALIGPRLRGEKGQFFTPRSLVRAMVAVLSPSPETKVVDPACGTGGFLVETVSYQQRVHREGDDYISHLIGIDKDADLAKLSESIIEVIAPKSGIIHCANSLDIGTLRDLPAEQNPFDADYVITNPPFGAKIKVSEPNILSQFELGHKWEKTKSKWVKTEMLRDGQDPQLLFLELCIHLLKENGKLGIVLPEGVFGNTGQGYVWDYLRQQGKVFALVDCPRTTFQPGTDTKTNILFFEKDTKTGQRRKFGVSIAVALHCGHDRRGRSTTAKGEAYPDDFAVIGDAFSKKQSDQEFWKTVSITNPYYLVPRYYEGTALEEIRSDANDLGAETISLGEMVRRGYLTMRKGHEVGAEAYGTGDVPFVRTSDITNYEISIDPTKCVSQYIYEKYKDAQNLMPGDILIICDGRYRIGRTTILTKQNYKCVIQSHIKAISLQCGAALSHFELLYLLNLPSVQRQIRNLIFIQSTLGSLGKRINEINVPIPKQTDKWIKEIDDFKSIIIERGKLLMKLKEFEERGITI